MSTVQSQLPLIDRLCQASRGTDRTEVLAVAAQFAEFCGWLYQDSGKPDSAVFWTNHALDYAQELNDPQVIAYVMMRKSNIATESGKPGYGLGLANAALNAFDALTPRIRAVSLRARANAQALLSEQREFEESVDQALIQAADGIVQDAPDHAIYCTPPYVAMEAGMSWVRRRRRPPGPGNRPQPAGRRNEPPPGAHPANGCHPPGDPALNRRTGGSRPGEHPTTEGGMMLRP